MREVRIVTVALDARTGLFDHEPLAGYLAEREVLRAEPHFFQHDGRPRCAVYLETRVLQGGSPAEALPPLAHPTAREGKPPNPADAAFASLLSELDEVEAARYQRIVHWRRDAARRFGLPPYVLCTNRQAFELARRAPRTLEALMQIKGFGKKTVQVHGRSLLEVLHGAEPPRGSVRSDPVREVDGDDAVVVVENAALSPVDAPHVEPQDRQPGVGHPGGPDDGSLQQGAAAAPDDGQ